MPAAQLLLSRPPAPKLRGIRSRKGFNLIEAAVVLGVVGLVIGGIWVAASTIKDKRNASKSISDIQSILTNYRRLWNPANMCSVNCGPAGATCIISDYLAGVYPGDFRGNYDAGWNGISITSPQGLSIRAGSDCLGASPWLSGISIRLEIGDDQNSATNPLPQSLCTAIARAVLNKASGAKALQLSANGNSGYFIAASPFSAAYANVGGLNISDFYCPPNTFLLIVYYDP